MSTRGSVCWKDGDKWLGVYNHSDSYPTWLGDRVFGACVAIGAAAVVRRLKTVGDWREYESGGVCEFCGKVAGQPHSISGGLYNHKGEGFPDPNAENHKHGDSSKDQSDPRKDPLFLEWVYVIIPETRIIEVWKSVAYKDRNPTLPNTGMRADGYTHVKVGEWDTSIKAPDFRAFELTAYADRSKGGK